MADIREAMQRDLTVAMKARDRGRISALRGALSAVANAEAQDVDAHSPLPAAAFSTEVDRKVLSEDDVRAIVGREREELLSAGEELLAHGRADDAAALRAQAELLAAYV